jgi:hypothetical protein
MSGWLSRAVGVFGGRPAAQPQPFDVRCPCGGRVAGERTDSSQLLGCPGCRQMLLVLPATVYPLPKRTTPPGPKPEATTSSTPETAPPAEEGSPRSLRKRRRGLAGADAPGPDVGASREARSNASPANSSAQAPPSGSAGLSPTVAPGRSTGVPTDRRAERKAANARFAAAVAAWRKKTFTPVRLVVAAVLLCLGGTGYWLRLRQEIQQAERVVTESSRLAELAVASRSWGEAADLYGRVESALDRLQRDDPPAQRLRQWSRETQALTNLLPTTLADLVDEAANGDWEARGLNWSEVFRSSHSDQWILLESTLPASEESTTGSTPNSSGDSTKDSSGSSASPPGEGETSLSIPLLVGPIRATVEGELAVLSKVPEESRPVRILIASRIAAIETVEGRWVVRLDGDSAFLWVHASTLAETGLIGEGDDLEAAQALLARQAQWTEVTE